MKIGVDASCWNQRRGFGRFTRELLRALLDVDTENEYTFLIDRPSEPLCDFPPRASRMAVPTSRAQISAASAHGYRTPADLWRMSRAAANGRFDLFFFPAVYSYFPLPPGPKCVVTFHDTIAERYPDLTFPNRRAWLFWRLKTWLACRQAHVVLTVSRHARDSLLRQWNLDPRRIRVVSEAPSPLFRPVQDPEMLSSVLARWGLSSTTPYLLYVGGISPHKNLDFLLRVFVRLVADPRFSQARLLLVGDYANDVFYSSFSDLQKTLTGLDPISSVIFTGYVSDEELLHLYNGALALVLPSLEEGFGLPVVEAMACGTPVLTSRAGSLPEVVGDAGLFFDARNPKELEEALTAVLTDGALRVTLSSRARERAQQFSWTRAADIVKELFRELLRS